MAKLVIIYGLTGLVAVLGLTLALYACRAKRATVIPVNRLGVRVATALFGVELIALAALIAYGQYLIHAYPPNAQANPSAVSNYLAPAIPAWMSWASLAMLAGSMTAALTLLLKRVWVAGMIAFLDSGLCCLIVTQVALMSTTDGKWREIQVVMSVALAVFVALLLGVINLNRKLRRLRGGGIPFVGQLRRPALTLQLFC